MNLYNDRITQLNIVFLDFFSQVEDIERMFVDLDKLKANNWVKEEAKKVNKKPVAKVN